MKKDLIFFKAFNFSNNNSIHAEILQGIFAEKQ